MQECKNVIYGGVVFSDDDFTVKPTISLVKAFYHCLNPSFSCHFILSTPVNYDGIESAANTRCWVLFTKGIRRSVSKLSFFVVSHSHSVTFLSASVL